MQEDKDKMTMIMMMIMMVMLVTMMIATMARGRLIHLIICNYRLLLASVVVEQ